MPFNVTPYSSWLRSSAATSTLRTNAATNGSCDARGPATFSRRNVVLGEERQAVRPPDRGRPRTRLSPTRCRHGLPSRRASASVSAVPPDHLARDAEHDGRIAIADVPFGPLVVAARGRFRRARTARRSGRLRRVGRVGTSRRARGRTRERSRAPRDPPPSGPPETIVTSLTFSNRSARHRETLRRLPARCRRRGWPAWDAC